MNVKHGIRTSAKVLLGHSRHWRSSELVCSNSRTFHNGSFRETSGSTHSAAILADHRIYEVRFCPESGSSPLQAALPKSANRDRCAAAKQDLYSIARPSSVSGNMRPIISDPRIQRRLVAQLQLIRDRQLPPIDPLVTADYGVSQSSDDADRCVC